MKAMTSSAVVGILIALVLFFTLNPLKSSDATLLIVLCVAAAVVLTTIIRAFIRIPNVEEDSGSPLE